jgi:prophage regulatory protein
MTEGLSTNADDRLDITDPDSVDFIDLATVRALTSLSASAVYRAINAGRFPRPVKLSTNISRWFRHEILAWRSARIAERDRRAA